MERNKTIIIKTRVSNDYIAYLKDHKEIAGCGLTPFAAMGDLIYSYNDIFNIDIIIEE